MSKQPKLRAVKQASFERAVVTDTPPGETPIIFSNEGFLERLLRYSNSGPVERFVIDSIVKMDRPGKPYTRPYKYRIRKSAMEFRRLSLLHPYSQLKVAEFYKEYQGHICHYCTRSDFSIRYPKRPAAIVYLRPGPAKSEAQNGSGRPVVDASQYTYFAYGGYDRLYRFFNSRRFVKLELKFPALLKMDVSKCFDSIYTHSIAWAVRGKEFSKSNVSIRAFGNDFDTLMQKSNFNETNGIPIGPEVSRIFAEVIFQKIDTLVYDKLAESNIVFGAHYEVVRYVDDIFIFGRDRVVAKTVYEAYSGFLADYNLHSNASKLEMFDRPFFTKKSKVIRDINQCINQFVDTFLKYPAGERFSLIPARIHRPERHLRSFVDAVKSACAQNEVSYDEVSPYIISALLQRTRLLVSVSGRIVKDNSDKYYFACRALLEASFFFYTVAPSVGSSYNLCETVIEVCRFTSRNIPADISSMRQLVHEQCSVLLDAEWVRPGSEIMDSVFLEVVNVALATSGHGDDFSLPVSTLERILPVRAGSDYFQLVCVLYYCRDRSEYAELAVRAVDEIDRRLVDISSAFGDSELAHLFLDAISCPYICSVKRRKWLLKLYKARGAVPPSSAEIDAYLSDAVLRPWFVNWTDEDVLGQIRRKRLMQPYA